MPTGFVPIRSKSNFLVFGAPDIQEAEVSEVLDSVSSGWWGTGPKVNRFENDFGNYIGSGFPVAVNSCTAALHLSLLCANLEPGDEVITSAMTFCATVNAIIHAGALPVVADIDPHTMNLDLNDVAARITPKTRAIVPIHFAGRACAMDQLMETARRHDLMVIEDCAHAIETEFRGKKAGTFGEFGCFSFYVTKNVATGEGGMVLARTEEQAGRIKVLALHGMSKDAWKRFSDEGFKHYDVVAAGFKYNMMDLQAALGIHQLARVEANWKRRKAIWQRYIDALKDCPVDLPPEMEAETRHAYHLFTIQIDKERAGLTRDAFLDAITAHNIGVGVHYRSIPEHPYYQERFGWQPQDCPVAMKVGRQTVSLPLSAKLTDQDVSDVIEAVQCILV